VTFQDITAQNRRKWLTIWVRSGNAKRSCGGARNFSQRLNAQLDRQFLLASNYG